MAAAALAAASGAVAVWAASAAPVAGSAAAAGAAGSLTGSFAFSLAQAASRLTNMILRIIFFFIVISTSLFKERPPDRLAYVASLGNHLLLHPAIAGNGRQYTTTLRLGRKQD